jgi:ABC-type nitrate/sulfonate/bicarbonate transport system permease component
MNDLLQTNRVLVVLAVFGVLGGVSDWAFQLATSRPLGRYLEVHGRS